MPDAEHLGNYFGWIYLVLTAALVIRLAFSGLWRSYPVFFSYISFQIFEGAYPLFIPIHTNTYIHVWAYTHWITLLLHILLVAEICRLILAGHPGIYSLGKWAIYVGVCISLAFSVVSLALHFKPHAGQVQISRVLPYYLAAGRGIDFALGIFLLLMLAFMSRFPFRLSRNVVIHVALYTFFFFAGSLSIFLRVIFGINQGDNLNLAMTVVSCACLLAWLVLLSQKGEQVRSAFPTFTEERETRILEQLDALNATLMRAGRKK